jgi:hypothetical protein
VRRAQIPRCADTSPAPAVFRGSVLDDLQRWRCAGIVTLFALAGDAFPIVVEAVRAMSVGMACGRRTL